jgi:hypothetical protein
MPHTESVIKPGVLDRNMIAFGPPGVVRNATDNLSTRSAVKNKERRVLCCAHASILRIKIPTSRQVGYIFLFRSGAASYLTTCPMKSINTRLPSFVF